MSEHRASDCAGQPAFRDHFPNAFRCSFLEVNRNERVTLSVVVEQGTEKWLRRRTDVAETQFAFFSSRSAAHAPNRFFHVLENERDFSEQHSARWREPDVMPCAFQHARAE